MGQNSSTKLIAPSSPKYLLLKGSGGAGLGDKVRALVSAVLYAKLSDRILCIDWRDNAYAGEAVNLFDHLFDLEDVPTIKEIPVVSSVRPVSWKGRLKESFDRIRALDGCRLDGSDWDRREAIKLYSFDQSRLDYPDEMLVMWEFDQFEQMLVEFPQVRLEFQTSDSIVIQAAIARKYIRVKPLILESISKVRFDFGPNSGSLIGVHVRLTDESEQQRNTPSLDQYWCAIDNVTDGLECYAIYLSTDNYSVLKAFQRRFGSERVFYLDKWFPVSGDSLHKNKSCPDPLSVAVDALREIQLLARCQKLVLFKASSFSFLARLFSTLRPEDIVDLSAEMPIARRLKSRLMLALKRTK